MMSYLDVWYMMFYLDDTFSVYFQCYCFTCVVSQYQELADGRGTYDYFYKQVTTEPHLFIKTY